MMHHGQDALSALHSLSQDCCESTCFSRKRSDLSILDVCVCVWQVQRNRGLFRLNGLELSDPKHEVGIVLVGLVWHWS